MRTLQELTRPNILALAPHSIITDGHPRPGTLLLNANENPYGKPFNRYPDINGQQLRLKLSQLKGVAPGQIFLGNGSDEAIDLCFRIFCEPRIDNVVAIDPTCDRYRLAARINDIEYRPVLLGDDYRLDAARLLRACDQHTKIVWLCSPNNPTGNLLKREEIMKVLTGFDGIVAVDEAYADFARQGTFRSELHDHPKLIVIDTLSKAWASAGIRLGMAYAQEAVIDLFERARPPHNISMPTQRQAMEILGRRFDVDDWVKLLLLERSKMLVAIRQLPICEQVYPSDTNFLLARMTHAQSVCDYLLGKGILVANVSSMPLCRDCLRITIGTKTENAELLSALRQYRQP